MDDEGIRIADVREAIGRDGPLVIEDYLADVRGAACLILGWAGAREPLHVVVRYGSAIPFVVTVYRPDLAQWLPGYRRRRRRR